MKTRLLFLSLITSISSALNAAPPKVEGVHAQQRLGTKFVDINYTLILDFNQTAFVELWFSHDNGLTFPIRCMDVEGDVDQNVTAGQKNVIWNAESDWNQRITSSGKIRVIATYGNQPSGFNGSGGGAGGGNSGSHDASMKQVPMTYWEYGPNPNDPVTFTWVDSSSYFNYEGPGAIGMAIDPIEVTNGLWDEVVNWASQNNAGYTGLTLKGGDPDMPASNVTYWQAIKWCNARSEMDGLTPAYYLDASEATGDINGNGVIDTGLDSWDPGMHPHHDPNGNGQYDPGEPYQDTDPNDGPFNPKEYEDDNNNGQYDPGLTQVFKQGALISLSDNTGIERNIRMDASGYRLPSYPVWATAITGGNYKKDWPWGDQSFPGSGGGGTEYDKVTMHQKYRVSTDSFAPEFNAPTKATDRQPNGFDLYDMLGNLAEWSEYVHRHDDGITAYEFGSVYGGSYLGIREIGNPNFVINHGGPGGTTPMRLTEAFIEGKPDQSSNAIGFRCMVYLR